MKNHIATSQQFLEMTVALGKARVMGLGPNQQVFERYCVVCGKHTEHISTETTDPGGGVSERLQCCVCHASREVKIL